MLEAKFVGDTEICFEKGQPMYKFVKRRSWIDIAGALVRHATFDRSGVVQSINPIFGPMDEVRAAKAKSFSLHSGKQLPPSCTC
jgi:hypothetical protein